ncbi:2OG-Fe(II) oxygenase [Burkholderiaceae bacterium DAT-1]|nr:2OG-Fe(II) oxygenase [Burkholderiaceae bacterium DAT-1]
MKLGEEWQVWLQDNLNRGCTHQAIFKAMTGAGVDESAARQFMQSAIPDLDILASIAPDPLNSLEYRYDPMPIPDVNRLDVGDRTVSVAMRCELPQVIVFDGVLTDDECDEIIARSRAKLTRSAIVDPATGAFEVIDDRSSEGTYFNRCEDAFITRIDTRIARLMHWPLENGEGLQILRYGVGAEYKPHFDYFPPSDPGSATHLAHGGQRVATLVLYLNDVEAGGATIFPEAGLSVMPRKGSAVYFRYLNGQGQLDPLSLHGGAPVVAGEKWIMTKWMRERAY